MSAQWIYDREPTHAGFYPVIICWDSREGCFYGAEHWSGIEWTGVNPGVVAFVDECWGTRAQAEQRAEALEPDNA